MTLRLITTLVFLQFCQSSLANDTLRITFLYGSKPAPNYESTQNKWFGGIHGGHVGVAGNTDNIYHFLPDKEFHVRKHYNTRHSKFVMSNSESFKYVFGTDTDSVKMLHILIPITALQKKTLDSLHRSYLDSTPYDYAFIG